MSLSPPYWWQVAHAEKKPRYSQDMDTIPPDTTPTPATPAAAAPITVPLRATAICKIGSMTLAPGKEFHATRAKADELIAANVAVELPPTF